MRVKRLVAFNGGSFCSARYTHRLLEHFCVSCLMGGIWKTIRRGREKKDRFIVNPCDCEILGWIYPVCDCVITWQYQSSGLCLKPPRVLCSNTHTQQTKWGPQIFSVLLPKRPSGEESSFEQENVLSLVKFCLFSCLWLFHLIWF